MTSIPQSNFAIADDRMPSRGLLSDLVALLMHPVAFFKTLRRKRNTHTVMVGVLILSSMVVFSLQNGIATTDMDMSSGFDAPIDSFPVDPGMVPSEAVSGDNPVDLWMTALTTISLQIFVWSALTVWLAQVSMYNNHKPELGKNLEIVIWSSIPLALMAILQTLFIYAGGTITESGFSGFLDEWSRFAELDILLQSWLHALTAQVTLFWIWHIALLYLSTRYVLRGKRSIVMFAIISWIISLSLINSFQSYQLLKDQLPIEELIAIEEPIVDEMPSDEVALELDSPMLPEQEVEMP